MDFELKFGDKIEILEIQAIKHGEELAIKRPQVDDSLYFYIKCFFALSSERVNGMNINPIPVTRIYKYYELLECNIEYKHDFVYLIQKLDNFYLNYIKSLEK